MSLTGSTVIYPGSFDPLTLGPDDIQNVLGSLAPDKREQLKAWLAQQLSA